MFKIAKLENVNNEKVSISLTDYEQSKFENNEKSSFESFRTLSFEISGNDYSLEFTLNCNLEKLLEIPVGETIDFNDYILEGETFLNIDGLNILDLIMNIKINLLYF